MDEGFKTNGNSYMDVFEKLAEKTEVDNERIKECPNCGESIHNKFMITTAHINFVRYECHSCCNIGDIWKKELEELEEAE